MGRTLEQVAPVFKGVRGRVEIVDIRWVKLGQKWSFLGGIMLKPTATAASGMKVKL